LPRDGKATIQQSKSNQRTQRRALLIFIFSNRRSRCCLQHVYRSRSSPCSHRHRHLG
jgi:hypothetical protein